MAPYADEVHRWQAEEMKKLAQKYLFIYHERAPLDVLPKEYHVVANATPAELHFGLPVDLVPASEWAVINDFPNSSFHPGTKILTWDGVDELVEKLSDATDWPITLIFPFEFTADGDFILALFSNYSMHDIERDVAKEAEVIEFLGYKLGLDESVKPRWYFDRSDPWKPKPGQGFDDFWWDEENNPHRYPSDSEDEDEDEDEDEGQDTE